MELEKLIDSLEVVSSFLGDETKEKELQNEVYSKFVQTELERINSDLISKGLIEKKIAVLSDGKWHGGNENVSILSQKVYPVVYFEPSLTGIEKLRLFDEKLEDIQAKALEIATNIKKNRDKRTVMYNELIKELREEGLFKHPELVTLTFNCYYTDLDGVGSLTIRYDNSYLDSLKVFLHGPESSERFLENEKAHIKVMVQDTWKKQQEKRKQQQMKDLKDYLESVLRRNYFKISEDLPVGTAYDLDKNEVSFNFDLSNEELKAEFEGHIQSSIDKIYEYEQLTEVNGPLKDIDLSKRFYYIFKEEKTVGEDIYRLYECRGTKRKALLKVFKNGIQLKGNARRRALKELGYGRELPTPVHT